METNPTGFDNFGSLFLSLYADGRVVQRVLVLLEPIAHVVPHGTGIVDKGKVSFGLLALWRLWLLVMSLALGTMHSSSSIDTMPSGCKQTMSVALSPCRYFTFSFDPALPGMTDGADALRRTPGNGRHFLVTCVEQSSNDDSASDYGETATLSSVFSCGQPDETSVPSNVVFKIGDSSVFGSSVTDSTGLSLALHNNYPETSSAITGTLSANSEPSVAHMIHSHSSRFHIVTLDDNPFRRGRWLCKEKQVTDEPKTSSDPSVETSGRRKFAVQPVTTDAPTISGNGPASLSSPALVTTSTPLVSANGSGRSEHSDRMTTASIAESDSFLSSVPEILSSGSPSSVVGTSGALDSVSHPSVAPEERSQTSASGIRSKPLLALVSGGETPGQMLDSLLPSMPSPIDTVVEQLSADQILREIERWWCDTHFFTSIGGDPSTSSAFDAT